MTLWAEATVPTARLPAAEAQSVLIASASLHDIQTERNLKKKKKKEKAQSETHGFELLITQFASEFTDVPLKSCFKN